MREAAATTRTKSVVNPKSSLKLRHLRNLTSISVPSLSAFFGRQFAAASEALGVPPDPSLFSCARCETILQPGLNCTIRIEKNRVRVRHRNKKAQPQHYPLPQNNVVYKCHFCSHRNQKPGTLRGYVKEIGPLIPKPPTPSKPTTFVQSASNDGDMKELHPLAINSPTQLKPTLSVLSESNDASDVVDEPVTPLEKIERSKLDAKRRKRNRLNAKRAAGGVGRCPGLEDGESSKVASTKRRRKSEMSLRQIVESEERARKATIT